MSGVGNAAKILKQGGLVAFPTETVYGLGADADNQEALARIFAVKRRPINHPLIVHIRTIEQMSKWALEVPETAQKLAEHFWPGPLTLILQKSAKVLDLVTGGQETIGLRIPNHPVALELLHQFGSGIAAPSANRFGRISPTSATAVAEELNGEVDLILDGGHCQVGVESTILDVSRGEAVILRTGMIWVAEIEKVIQQPVIVKNKSAVRVSGTFESHYAPTTETRLIDHEQIELLFEYNQLPTALLTQKNIHMQNKQIKIYSMPADPEQYAHILYQTLREADNKHFKQILIEQVPTGVAWDAIRDRIAKATGMKKYQ